MSSPEKTVATVIIAERKSKGMSQGDMAKELGVSRRQYQRIEAGSSMRIGHLISICKVLELEFSIVKVQKEIKLI